MHRKIHLRKAGNTPKLIVASECVRFRDGKALNISEQLQCVWQDEEGGGNSILELLIPESHTTRARARERPANPQVWNQIIPSHALPMQMYGDIPRPTTGVRRKKKESEKR